MNTLTQMRQTAQSFSEGEMKTRVDLAACYRMTQEYRMTDQVNGFIGSRLEDDPTHFVTKKYGDFPAEVTASGLLKIPVKGHIDIGYGTDYNGAAIHMIQAVMGAHPDVGCVLHAHTKATTVFAALKADILPISQPGFMLYKKVAYSDFSFDADEEFCNRLLVDLGPHKVMIMRNHGLFIAAKDAAEALLLTFLLDQACAIQIECMKTGAEMNIPDLQDVEKWSASYKDNDHFVYDGSLEWPGILRTLDKKDPSFRN